MDEPWLEVIRSSATWEDMRAVYKTKNIAACEAKLINRRLVRKSFWSTLEGPTSETSDLAFTLFDRYGRLNREYYEHDFKKGTGVWGKELDHGEILLFESVEVDEHWQRRGVGAKLVNAILEKAKQKVGGLTGPIAVVQPIIRRGIGIFQNQEQMAARHEEIKGIEVIARNFWRSLGFRRIGTSDWFARIDSPDHPSRHLEPSSDWEPPEEPRDVRITGDFLTLFRATADRRVKDDDCINILQILSGNPGNQHWLKADKHSNTLLHLAAMSSKPQVVKFMLSKAAGLAGLRNWEGYTPLEALENRLELSRTRESMFDVTAVVSDEFRGYSDASIACMATLRNIEAFELSTLSPSDIEFVSSATDEQANSMPHINVAGIRKCLQLKFGCTCGECIGGFISPRMSFALIYAAETEHDNIMDFPYWVAPHGYTTYVPYEVQEKIETDRSVHKGFAELWLIFARCLSNRMVPSENGIMNMSGQHSTNSPPAKTTFLAHGGSVSHVAKLIFEQARIQDEWAGHGLLRENLGNNQERIDKLPACRNDHEFGFVSGMCGYDIAVTLDGFRVDV
ncbi:hypothetical protein F5Y04DRAFT_242589 [Hypomontagnella monticulosa]|nr:hypothetical protein F5Y04DRAFT_242589 [Hypomontagnella monticulosa]